MKKTVLLSAMFVSAALFAQNVVQNGGFDSPWTRNASQGLHSVYDVDCRIYSTQAAKKWQFTPFEGWWLNQNPETKVTVEDGGGFIRVSGSKFALCSSPVPRTAANMVLSCDVRTTGAHAKMIFEGVSHPGNYARSVTGTKFVDLPENTQGKTVHLTVPYEGMTGTDVAVRLDVADGTVELDNVQIEPGTEATAFNVRPQEYFDVTLGNFTIEEFPRFYTETAEKQSLVIKNKSREKLAGKINIYMDKWDNPSSTLYKSMKLRDLEPGKSISCKIDPAALPPNAYRVLVEYVDNDGKVVVSKDVWNADNTGSGYIGKSMIAGHNGLRFGVYQNIAPEKIFGVGNGMVGQGLYYGGQDHKDFAWAKDLHYTGFLQSAAEQWLFDIAAGGAEAYGTYHLDMIDEDVTDPSVINPAYKGAVDFTNPKGREIILKRAEKMGKMTGKGPGFAAFKMRNESPYLANSATCPTESADAAFREWVKKRYKTLENVNKAWHSNYQDWDEIVQIVSAKLAKEETHVEKTGAAAIDWYAHMGNFNDTVVALMNADPGRAMDWCRWRSAASLEMYAAFRSEMKKHDPDLLVGTNFCWPNFWPHISMPFWRFTDAPMMDMQYPAHMSIDYGNCDEMIDMIEMAQSSAPGKPIWGIEIYYQPSFHADVPPVQNWGMLAHGMYQNLVFAWRPYADVGPQTFKDGPGAWKKEKAPQMWMMIDIDGSELPAFHTNNRSVLEVEDFHKRFDGTTFRRVNTRTAYYIPNDTSEFVIMTTADKPFQSVICNSRTGLGSHFRMAGATLQYMDDFALLHMDSGDYDTVVVPPSPVMSRKALAKLAEFAKNGGTVVFVGPCAIFDPCLNPYNIIGGNSFVKGWKVPEAWKDYKTLLADFGAFSRTEIIKMDVPAIPGGKPLKNAKDEVIGSVSKIGDGKLVQLNSWPYRYEFENIQYTPEFKEAIGEIVKIVNPSIPARWVDSDSPETKGYGRPGIGAPFVEVVIREKEPGKCLFFTRSVSEKILFVLNRGGAGKGKVVLDDPGWKVEDVITGVPVPVFKREIPLELPAFGYRVLRMTR